MLMVVTQPGGQAQIEKKKVNVYALAKMDAHDIMLIIRFCVNQRFSYMCKVDMDPRVTANLRDQIDEDMFGFGGQGELPTGLFWRVLMAMGADEIPQQLQQRLLRRVQMREEDGGLGLQSARTLGMYASLSAIATVMSTKAAVVTPTAAVMMGLDTTM